LLLLSLFAAAVAVAVVAVAVAVGIVSAVACSPSPICHFDRSDSQLHRESRSGEIRFSTHAPPSPEAFVFAF
jgi:hypothetical protein